MNAHCRIKFRNWDTPKGLEETISEVMTLDELFNELVDGNKKHLVHSIILEGTSTDGEPTKVILDISTITHD